MMKYEKMNVQRREEKNKGRHGQRKTKLLEMTNRLEMSE